MLVTQHKKYTFNSILKKIKNVAQIDKRYSSDFAFLFENQISRDQNILNFSLQYVQNH